MTAWLDRLHELADRAPGERWQVEDSSLVVVAADESDDRWIADAWGADGIAVFIAAVRNLWPELVAVAEAASILSVIINEPTFKGLTTPEDFRLYFKGACLGLDEALSALAAAVEKETGT